MKKKEREKVCFGYKKGFKKSFNMFNVFFNPTPSSSVFIYFYLSLSNSFYLSLLIFLSILYPPISNR